MKYQFIEEHKHEFPIVVMCGVLVVSESGFYAWRQASNLSTIAAKMLICDKRYSRYLKRIKADMDHHVSTETYTMKESRARENGWPG